MALTRDNVRAFLNRDWTAARKAKDEALGAWVRSHGATRAFQLSQLLLDQVWDRVRRDEARGRDVAGLVRLRGVFRRAHAAEHR